MRTKHANGWDNKYPANRPVGPASSKRGGLAFAASLAVLAISLSACSGSSGSEAASNGQSTSTGASTSSGDTSCMTTAKALVEQARTVNALNIPTTPLDLAKVKGKTIYFITPDLAFPQIATQAQVTTSVANILGVKLVVVNGAGQVAQWNSGIQTAINQHAAAILVAGIQADLIGPELAKAKAAGIPVISTNNVAAPPGVGIVGSVDNDNALGARWSAALALSEGGCSGTYAFVYTSTYTETLTMYSEAKAYISQLCPQCNFVSVDIPGSDITTQSGPDAQILAKRYPDLKVIITAGDDFSNPMVPALKSINSKVLLISTFAGTQQNLQYLADGNIAGSVVDLPPEAVAYMNIDALARAIAGQPQFNEHGGEVEDRGQVLLTQQTPDPTTALSATGTVWAALGDYAQAFQKVWGVSS
jgi:ABC-type sugar transport system substrate-binding protein